MLSECCWLACESVPAAVEDGLLRLCTADNSVLPPIGEELRTDHPLLGRRRARNDENWRMQVYLSLRRNRDDIVSEIAE